MLFISSDRRRLASAPRDQRAPECATRHGRLPVMKRIGVLGGMSPQATMDLESRVHHVSQRIVPQDWNAGYPPMVVWFHRRRPIRLGPDGSPMVPLQVDPELVEAARWLGKGVDFLVIPCNAAHVGVAQIEETVRRGWRRVGVLGFRSAPAVYTGPLGDRGIACVEIDGTRQARLDAAIRAVMEGRTGEDETDVARSAVTALRAARVDGVVLGCTEIPLLLGEEAEAPDLVSPLSLLAESAVRFAVGDGASLGGHVTRTGATRGVPAAGGR
jgi:aspartate racemase